MVTQDDERRSLKRFNRILVVEDSPSLGASIVEALAGVGDEIELCRTVRDALERLEAWKPHLIVADVRLPDGNAVELLQRSLTVRPAPCVVGISGEADRREVFDLAQLGMQAFVEKPFDALQLKEAVERALAAPPRLEPHVRNQLGHATLKTIEDRVRSTLVDEALARSGNNRRAAARLLSVTRQALQHILRRRDSQRMG